MAVSESSAVDAANDLEMTEVDGALMRELLKEFAIDATDGEQVECEAIRSPESKDGPSPVTKQAQNGFVKESVLVHNFCWIDEITKMNPVVPSGDAMGWYTEEMVGLLEFDFNDASTDEMGYSCLWDYS